MKITCPFKVITKHKYHVGIFLLVLLLGFIKQIDAQNFHLVKDIENSTNGSPSNVNNNQYSQNNIFAILNGVSYFAADDGIHGRGLWRSDGTELGTFQIKDSIDPRNIIVVNGELLFIGNGAIGLWKSDGTEAGTVPLFNALPPGLFSFVPFGLTNLNGTIFFAVTTKYFPYDQLWKTDGTVHGTVLVKDFYTGVFNNTLFNISRLTAIKNKLYFAVAGSDYLAKLWVSDGSGEGTYKISENIIEPGQMIAGSQDLSDPSVYFTGSTSRGGDRSLYVTRGEPGVAAICSGFTGILAPYSYYGENILSIGGFIYFVGRPNTSTQVRSLYKYDISNPAGIQAVKIAGDLSATGNNVSHIFNPFTVNGVIYFSLYDAPTGKNQWWKTDGTSLGNVLLKDSLSLSGNFINADGVIYFQAFDSEYGAELWKSNGTASGTLRVKDINAGINSSWPSGLTYVNKKILFAARDNLHGAELWQSDGTAGGTLQIKDINQFATGSSDPTGFIAYNNLLVFSNYDGVGNGQKKPWRSDGTNAGTSIISDSIYTQYYQPFLTFNNELYFWANTISGKEGLVKTDGSSTGTVLVKNFTGFEGGFSDIMATDKLIFLHLYNRSTAEYELWRTDGTDVNTFMIKSGPSFSVTEPLALGNELYFVNSGSRSLWKTDGTIIGTVMIKTFASYPFNLKVNNGLLFFRANDGLSNALWKSDGSSEGTVKVTDKVTDPEDFISSNGSLFFTGVGNTGIYGNINRELYKTDGSDLGTVLVKDVHPGNIVTLMYFPIDVNGTMYFLTDGTISNKTELWKSDGTSVGTALVSSIGDQNYQRPYKIVSCNGKLLFFINSVLWESDGTQLGTHPTVDDIFSNIVVNDYNYLTAAGNQVFFTATNYQYGYELYAGTITPAVATYITTANGDWNNSATWQGNIIPPAGANIIIRHNVIGNISTACNSLRVESPGTLNINTGVNVIVLH